MFSLFVICLFSNRLATCHIYCRCYGYRNSNSEVLNTTIERSNGKKQQRIYLPSPCSLQFNFTRCAVKAGRLRFSLLIIIECVYNTYLFISHLHPNVRTLNWTQWCVLSSLEFFRLIEFERENFIDDSGMA